MKEWGLVDAGTCWEGGVSESELRGVGGAAGGSASRLRAGAGASSWTCPESALWRLGACMRTGSSALVCALGHPQRCPGKCQIRDQCCKQQTHYMTSCAVTAAHTIGNPFLDSKHVVDEVGVRLEQCKVCMTSSYLTSLVWWPHACLILRGLAQYAAQH